MADDPDGGRLEPEAADEDKTAITESQARGPAFYGALALVGALVLLIVVFNLSGARASSGMLLTQNTWTLQSYVDSRGVLVPAIPGTPVTARFKTDGTITGSGRCNSYNASYSTKDLAISISQPDMTEIYCENVPVMQMESAYINDLSKAEELRVNASNLNLYDKTGKPVLMFVALG
jgi:heat shock protein HslJ